MGVVNWIRGHMQVSEDLGVSDEKVPDLQKVWRQALKDIGMHCGALRMSGPLYQDRLVEHMAEGCNTMELMMELEISWKEVAKIRRLYPGTFRPGNSVQGGMLSPAGRGRGREREAPGTVLRSTWRERQAPMEGIRRDLNFVKDEDLTEEEWRKRQQNRQDKHDKLDRKHQGQERRSQWETWKPEESQWYRGKPGLQVTKREGYGLDGGRGGKGGKGKGGKGEEGKGGKGKGLKGAGLGGKGDWGSRRHEVSYDKDTGSISYKVGSKEVESFGTEDDEGKTIAEFLGDASRKVCAAYGLSPLADAKGHCCDAQSADHQGMDAAAHRGLKPEIRKKMREHFRLG